jgi:hypothetical protein
MLNRSGRVMPTRYAKRVSRVVSGDPGNSSVVSGSSFNGSCRVPVLPALPRFKLLFQRGSVIKVVQLGECGPMDEKIEPNIKSLLDQYGLLFQGPKGL